MYSPYGGYGRVPYGQPQMLPPGQPYPGGMTVPGGVVIPPSNAAPYDPSGSSTTDDWQPFENSNDGFENDGFGTGGTTGGSASGTDSGVPRPDMFEQDSTEPFGSLDDSTSNVQASAFRQPSSGGRMYGYAKKDYAWLRGIIGYDDADGTHDIIYALKPDDEYGGSFVFIPDPQLSRFRRGDIVLVTGRIDRTVSGDKYGKPRYRITSIEKVVPR